MRNKRVLALAAMLIAIAGISFLVHRRANRPRTAAPALVADPGKLASTNAAPKPRSAPPTVPRVNQYAVVRPGICVPSNVPDQEEASRKKWEALLRDPFWQSIFSGVDPEKFYLVKTSLPMQRYVTYWKMKDGQLIHWTGKKILIPAGTRVFTNGRGEMYLCACGNQVASVLPTEATVLSPEEEPPEADLVPPEPEPFSAPPSGFPFAPPQVVTAPPNSESEWIPPIPPILAPFGGGPEPVPIRRKPKRPKRPKAPSHPPPQPPPPQPVVPEPGTWSLTLIGFGACILVLRHRKRQGRSAPAQDCAHVSGDVVGVPGESL